MVQLFRYSTLILDFWFSNNKTRISEGPGFNSLREFLVLKINTLFKFHENGINADLTSDGLHLTSNSRLNIW